jgi:hypothetical protein
MKWNRIRNEGVTYFVGRTKSLATNDFKPALKVLWLNLLEVLAKDSGDNWNAVVCAFRPDSGKAGVYPVDRDEAVIAPVSACVWLIVPAIEELYSKLPDGGDAAFEREHGKLIRLLRSAATDAAIDAGVQKTLDRLRPGKKTAIYSLEYSDTETLKRLQIKKAANKRS